MLYRKSIKFLRGLRRVLAELEEVGKQVFQLLSTGHVLAFAGVLVVHESCKPEPEPALARVEGTVTNLQGRGVKQVTVTFHQGTGPPWNAQTGLDGRFVTLMPPGRYAVAIDHCGQNLATLSIVVTGKTQLPAVAINPDCGDRRAPMLLVGTRAHVPK
jgi:hypothetical protein